MPTPKKTSTTAEATDTEAPAIELVTIPFRGKTFTIPKDMDEWDTEACLAFSRQELLLAAKMLLGPAQWALLQSVGSKRKDTLAFLAVLGPAINKHCITG